MRTFVAVEIDNILVLDSIKNIQKNLSLQAKPVDTQNMHFTMMFLGEISEDVIQKIQNALSEIKFSEFVIKFIGVGAFPKVKSPRVIWVGVDEKSSEQLKALAIKVENTLSPLGFHNDKSFQPHVTIFRIKNKIKDISDELKKHNNYTIGMQKISKMKLKESKLTPNGPIYSDMQVIKAQ